MVFYNRKKKHWCLLWRFQVYIGSSNVPVIVYMDHNPLLHQMHNKNRHLMIWSLCVQAFNVVVRHVRGRDNVLADVLSHL